MPGRRVRRKAGHRSQKPPPSWFPWKEVLSRLRRHYATGTWRVPALRERGVDPFAVLVSTVLSHQARDEATELAYCQLSEKYPDAKSLANANPKEVIELIRPVGLTESKGTGLIALSKELVEQFNGRVPEDYESLLKLPRVGPKTASAVLVFGFKVAAIPVDTHIHRVVNRLGVVVTERPEETQRALECSVPRHYWGSINPILVQHGQNLCSARAPKCPTCPVSAMCSYSATSGFLPVGSAPGTK